MSTIKLRAGTDVQIETVLTGEHSKKRIIVSIETDEDMPKVMGKCTFEFHGTVPTVSTNQCKNVVHNFVKHLTA